MACYVLENDQGEPLPVHSIASGLDYPGVGPQHSLLKDLGRVDGDEVRVRIQGARGLILEHVIVRVRGDYRLRLHLDTDEGNAAGLKGGEHAVVVQ